MTIRILGKCFLFFFLFSFVAEANRRSSQSQRRTGQNATRRAPQQQRPAPQCPAGIARSSIYYVADEAEMCGGAPRCSRFTSAVRNQGSGWLRNGNILKYHGGEEPARGCHTARGAWGTCLTTYISIAADDSFYRLGDIIEIPKMRGQVVRLPGGRTMRHPGFFRVEDRGGEIQGVGRFDFFTGRITPENSGNSFGRSGNRETQMLDPNDCDARKSYRRIRPTDPRYSGAIQAINQSLQEAGQPLLPQGRIRAQVRRNDQNRQQPSRQQGRRGAR